MSASAATCTHEPPERPGGRATCSDLRATPRRARAEADALLAELTKEMRPVVATMLFAGLRVSEALGLCWADLDLQAGTVHVHRQLGRDGKKHAPLKTTSSAGVLAIPEPLLVILREHRARMAALGFERVAPDRLVFQTTSGRSPGRNNVTRAVRVVSKRLGYGQVGAHDLPTLLRLDAQVARLHVRAHRALPAPRLRPHD